MLITFDTRHITKITHIQIVYFFLYFINKKQAYGIKRTVTKVSRRD